jgi:hypothetical protein
MASESAGALRGVAASQLAGALTGVLNPQVGESGVRGRGVGCGKAALSSRSKRISM